MTRVGDSDGCRRCTGDLEGELCRACRDEISCAEENRHHAALRAMAADDQWDDLPVREP